MQDTVLVWCVGCVACLRGIGKRQRIGTTTSADQQFNELPEVLELDEISLECVPGIRKETVVGSPILPKENTINCFSWRTFFEALRGALSKELENGARRHWASANSWLERALNLQSLTCQQLLWFLWCNWSRALDLTVDLCTQWMMWGPDRGQWTAGKLASQNWRENHSVVPRN